ncbi:MAG: hypothetical protein U0L59_07210 [Faecalimonas sp.]|nr:hypothetical protein [Faecalimonas sp.]
MMNKEKKVKYYSIRASVMWLGVLLCALSIVCVTMLLFGERSGFHSETVYAEYGTITSELHDKEKCYLCGSSDDSMMDYYGKFDTIGIIGLNQWHILDLRLKEYDSEGNAVEKEGSSNDYGSMQGVKYSVSATPSRGMSNVTIESTDGMFNERVVEQHLCQECLDKVTGTLARDVVKGKEEYFPFCLVDFETLELYPVQSEKHSYFIRDYYVEVEQEESKVFIQVYYLLERNIKQ